MSTAALRHEPDLEIDGFLAFLDAQPDKRWELHEGVPRPMVRPTRPHARIVANLLFHLRASVFTRGFDVLSDVLVQVDPRSGYAPDIAVLPALDEDSARGSAEPLILFEVLSPSTMEFDRAAKSKAYRALSSLQQLVFVYQDSVRVESWSRQGETWLLRPTILVERDDTLALPPLSASLGLAEIYERVTPSPLID